MADVYTRIGYIKGDTGATGAQGAKGDTGDAATIEVGTVTTVPYGQTASVVNSGTSGAAVFDFTIPQGRPGQETTDMQNLVIGAITTSSASFPVPAVGETGKVLWGKVVKWFSDMSALVATKLNISSVVNNLTTTASGYALDARQGKALNDSLTAVIGQLATDMNNANTTGTYRFNNSVANIPATGAYGLCWVMKDGNYITQYAFAMSNQTFYIRSLVISSGIWTNWQTVVGIEDTFQVKSYTFEYSCASNSSVSITGSQFGVSTPSGYSVIGVQSYFTGSQYVFAYRLTPQNTGAQTVMSLHNASNGTVTVTATINILYAKSMTL